VRELIALLILLAALPAGATQYRYVAGAADVPDGAPSFSPDGAKVAFSSPMLGDNEWEIWIVDNDGENLTNFTNSPGIDIYANWSPAGPWIVFTSRRDNGHGVDDMDLWIQSTDADSLRNLTTHDGYDNFAAIDPTGTLVAFTSDRGGEKEIWLMPLDGSAPATRLSDGPIDCLHACWSPDGLWVAFDGREPGDFTHTYLYRVPAAGGATERIETGLQVSGDPGWSPDGRYLAFAGGDHTIDWDLWAWDFEARSLVQITDTRFPEQSPVWNSAGTEIVYAALPQGHKDVWLAYELDIVAVAPTSMSRVRSLFR